MPINTNDNYSPISDTYRYVKILIDPDRINSTQPRNLYSAKRRLLILVGYFRNLPWQGQLENSQQTMLVIMGNALQPTQRLFVITIVESENITFFSFPIRG